MAQSRIIPPEREPPADVPDLALVPAAEGLLLQAALAERAEGR